MVTDRKSIADKIVLAAMRMGGGVVTIDFRRLKVVSQKQGVALIRESNGTIIDGVGVSAKGRLIWIPD